MVVIVGETASGKSALAIGLARKFNGEIISADSWQVYKNFNIGTAKPTVAEQQEMPHHIIDIADPTQGFSAAIYKILATQAIKDIAARGKLPIMVGGTGLYIDSVLFDFSFMASGDPKQRAVLQKKSNEELIILLGQKQIDLTGIDIHNKRRLIRLI